MGEERLENAPGKGRRKSESAILTVRWLFENAQVSFVDSRGVRHSTIVHAGSVEAAAAGLKQIRETEMISDDGVLELTVDLTTTTSHRVPLSKLNAWLQSSGRDPREAAAKAKLR